MLLKALALFLVSVSLEALVVLAAWNYGIAPVFHVGTLDFAGACAIVVFLMVIQQRLGLRMERVRSPSPSTSKESNDEPPKTF